MCGTDTQAIPIRFAAGGAWEQDCTAVQPLFRATPIGPFLGIFVAMVFKLRRPVSLTKLSALLQVG